MHCHPRGISRRRFLSGLAASAAVPAVVSRRTLAGQGRAAPSERITLGAIGIGHMMYGSHLPHFLRMPEVQVVAVCDVDQHRREAGRQRVNQAYGDTGCRAYADHRQLLARDDLDAVVCATPDHWHALVILDACQAGKDIYCEKPLTNNLLEAKAVMDAVNATDIVFQTGSQQRASGNFRYACELVRNGRIGRIQRVTVGVGGPPMACDLPAEDAEPGLDWERWLGPAPLRPYNSTLSPRGMHSHFPAWRRYLEFGGGGMTDWGAHHFDIAQWGLGMDQSGPVSIVPPPDANSGRGVKFIYAGGTEVVHGGDGGVTFYGTDGHIHVDRGKLSSQPEEIIRQAIGDDDVHLYRAPSDSHNGHRQDWINCVRSRQQPNCPVETGARTVAVCHLGNIVYLHSQQLDGQALTWDAQQWEFVDNEQANPWRGYPYPRRDGYELAAAKKFGLIGRSDGSQV